MKSQEKSRGAERGAALAWVLWTTVFVASASPSSDPLPPIVFSFESSVPSGVTLHNLELDADGGLVLTKDDDGNYVSEGYLSLALPREKLEGRLVRVEAVRVNSIAHGDFQSVSRSDIETCNTTESSATGSSVTCGDDDTAPELGTWYCDCDGKDHRRPYIDEDDAGNRTARIERDTLEQVFPVSAGETYRVSFDLDALQLADDTDEEVLSVYVKTWNEEMTEQLKVDMLYQYEPEDGVLSDGLLFRVIDCDEHVMYDDEDDLLDPLTFTYCDDFEEDEIKLMSIVFKNGSNDGVELYATLDNVVLDRRDQLEIAVQSFQRSTLVDGVMIEPVPYPIFAPLTLTLHVRSHFDDRSPRIRSLSIQNGKPIRVEAGELLAEFVEPRLGNTGWVDFDNNRQWNDLGVNRLTTAVIDVFSKGCSVVPFYRHLVDNGLSRWRNAMIDKYFEISLDESTGEVELAPTQDCDPGTSGCDPGADREGETMLKRYRELADYGIDILEIADPDGFFDADGSLKSEFEVDLSDITIPDGLPDEVTAEDIWAIELNAQYVARLTEMFDGTQTLELSDGTTLSLPQIDDWQVLVEHNLSGDSPWYWSWFGKWKDSDLYGSDYWSENYPYMHTYILNRLAETIAEADSAASIATSINCRKPCLHDEVDYFENYWSDHPPSSDLFTHFGINTFTKGKEPELYPEAIEELSVEYLPSSWLDKPLAVGAYREETEGFDPGDDYSATLDEWERGYGRPLFGKRLARSTLVNLSLPAEQIYYYNINNQIFDKQLDRCEPAIVGPLVEPNEAGIAYLTLSRNLSTSSPRQAWITAETPDDEHYHAAVFRDAYANPVIALWFYREYEHAVETEDYVSGIRDTGFLDRRVHDVILEGFPRVRRDPSAHQAIIIQLDGSPRESRPLALVDGSLMVRGVVFGEMPVLVKLLPAGASGQGDL